MRAKKVDRQIVVRVIADLAIIAEVDRTCEHIRFLPLSFLLIGEAACFLKHGNHATYPFLDSKM